MNLRKLIFGMLAVTAVSIFTSSAFAAQVAGGTPASVPAPNLTIYYSGATAQDGTLKAKFASICDLTVGVPLFIEDDGGDGQVGENSARDGRDFRAFFCPQIDTTIAGLGGLSVSTNVLIYKRREGGSGWGVESVAKNQPIAFFDVVNAGTTTGGAANTPGCTDAGADTSLGANGRNYVCDRENPGTNRDLRPVESVGVSGPVELLVMMPHNIDGVFKPG